MRQICDEMINLRKMLDDAGIKWEDKSSVASDEIIQRNVAAGIDKNFADYTIYRTHFEHKNYKYSVIYGYGTYGGYDVFNGNDAKLLECMTNKVNVGDPLGWLTAEQVMEIVNRGE